MKAWLVWTLLAVVCWGIWAIVAKLMGEGVSPVQSQVLSTLGIIPVMALLGFSRSLKAPGRAGIGASLAVAAGVLTCLGNMAYYDVLNRGAKAATVVPLTALYPLVTVMLAVIFLRERLNRVQLAGIVISLAAIYLFNVREEQGLLSAWLLMAAIPIALWGVAGLLQKIATNHLSGELSALLFLAAFIPVGAVLQWKEPLGAAIPGKIWLLGAALGFAFALGNFALLEAFARNGKASVIAPLAGLYPVVSIPAAMLLFGERVGLRETAGIALALAGVAALSLESAVKEGAVQPPSTIE